jgi:hypothetical protein
MGRHIDQITSSVRSKFPDVRIVQMTKTHPADDDGIWWFRLPGKEKDIQIESSSGNCPFIVESDDDPTVSDARSAKTVEDVVAIVCGFLESI